MAFVEPTTLHYHGITLEPLQAKHAAGLRLAVLDGELWKLRITFPPHPDEVDAYIATALAGAPNQRVPFAVIEQATGKVLGSTSYHDIIPEVKRVEIGYTWYAQSAQRTHVNTACKFILLQHAFETLGCAVVGWRTDNFNFASQRAIERLGAKKDGVIRHHALRKDGTVRDTVMYSLLAGEWPEVKAHLLHRLTQIR